MVFKGTERRTRPGAGARARGAGRQPRRLHRPRPHQLPGPRPRRRSPAGGRDPHRSGPPAAAPARATSSPSAMWSSRRSTGWRTRPTISSSSSTPRRSGRSTPTATRFSGTPRHAGGALGRRSPVPASARATTAGTAWSPRRATSTTTSCSPCSSGKAGSRAPCPSRRAGRSSRRPRCRAATRHRASRDTAQTHIVFGTDTFPLRDPRRFALAILTNVFGGGMSSRLFQRVREELGLAYAVFAYKHFYQASGQLGVYVGTQPATADAGDRGHPRRSTPARPRGPAGRRAGRRQAAAQGPDHALAREPGRADGPAGRASCSTTTSTARSTRCWRRSTRSRRSEIATVAAEFFAPERQTVVRLGPEP